MQIRASPGLLAKFRLHHCIDLSIVSECFT